MQETLWLLSKITPLAVFDILLVTLILYGLLMLIRGTQADQVVRGVLILLIASAVAMMRGPFQIGWWAALIIAVLLLLRFGSAAFSNFKMMPGGLMIILSVIAIIVLLLGRTPARM